MKMGLRAPSDHEASQATEQVVELGEGNDDM